MEETLEALISETLSPNDIPVLQKDDLKRRREDTSTDDSISNTK